MLKKEVDSTTILYPNHRFKTNIIELFYPIKVEEKDLVSALLVSHLLMHTSAAYPSEELHHKEVLKHSILHMGCGQAREGKQYFYKMSLVIPDAEALQEDVLEEAFAFFIDTIYHPNIEGKGFQKEEFEKELASLTLAVQNNNKDVLKYSYHTTINLLDTSGFLKEHLLFNHQDLLTTTTCGDAYAFYEKNIATTRPYIFVFGKVEEQSIKKLVQKYVLDKNLKIVPIQESLTNYLPCHENPIVKEEKGPYHQSVLEMVYKVKDFTKKDQYLLRTVDLLLSSLSSLILHKFLRDKEQLVYQTSSSCSSVLGTLWITALLYKENKERAINSVKEAMESLKDIAYITPLLDNIHEKQRLSLIRRQDKKFALLHAEEDVYFGMDESIEKQNEEMQKITAHDVQKFIERLELDVTYFLEGEKNAQ